MSFLVVTFGVERGLALRRHKVLPPELISGLGTLASQKGGLDPRKAYKLCQQHPSAAASVIKAMLLKIGRPHSELEQAVADASSREASRLYANVRWLGLSAGVTPLMGLLGTVWGMIQAFFVTAHLPTGANKAEHLADGIYVALVTTFAGLAVAIPAAVLAHLFEGRIQRLLLELDETLLGLMPQLERFEGKLRVSREIEGSGRTRRELAADEEPPVEEPKSTATMPK
jgi:biopolymer transport protein ExbB